MARLLGLSDLAPRVSSLPALGQRSQEVLDELDRRGWSSVLREIVAPGAHPHLDRLLDSVLAEIELRVDERDHHDGDS